VIIMNSKRRMPSILSILGEEKDGEEGSEKSPGELEQIAHELIEGVHSRNVGDVVAALKACFACLDEDEHEGG